MNSSVLKQIINNNQPIPKVLVFIEEEPVNVRAYIKLISKRIGLPVEIYDTADNAIYDIETGLEEDKIYYILNDEKILKNSAYIPAFNELDQYIIVGFDGVKISDNFLRDNAQFIYTFEKGDADTLLKYIRKRYTVFANDTELRDLIACSDNKLSQINNELDKISLLSEEEQKEYFKNKEYPDIRQIDNMSVMLMVLNKNKEFFKHIDVLINNAVQSLLAIYTMARKRFVSTNDKYYAKLMVLCFKAHSSIIDGTMTSENAMKKFVGDLI